MQIWKSLCGVQVNILNLEEGKVKMGFKKLFMDKKQNVLKWQDIWNKSLIKTIRYYELKK